jgi:hypothetical protein
MDMQPIGGNWRARLRAWWPVASQRFKYRYLKPLGVPITDLRFHGRRWRFPARQRVKAVSKPAPWSRIRGIGNSPAVRVAAAIPFVGYIILLNDRLADFMTVYPALSVFSTATPPWNLICLYFGSFLTGLGAIVYAIRCPDFLKRYAIFAEYRNAERDLWRNPAFGARKRALLDAEIRRDVSDGGVPGLLSSRNHRGPREVRLEAAPRRGRAGHVARPRAESRQPPLRQGADRDARRRATRSARRPAGRPRRGVVRLLDPRHRVRCVRLVEQHGARVGAQHLE